MKESRLKSIRTANFLSQVELAEMSGVSAKTIQRIESNKSVGSSYSIKQLAEALAVDPIELSEINSNHVESNLETQNGLSTLKLLNLSTLFIVLIPLSNILLPSIILRKNSDDSFVNFYGKKVISIQILWTLASLVLMIFLPLMLLSLGYTHSGGIPLFIPIYYLTVLFNITLILWISYMFANRRETELQLPNLL